MRLEILRHLPFSQTWSCKRIKYGRLGDWMRLYVCTAKRLRTSFKQKMAAASSRIRWHIFLDIVCLVLLGIADLLIFAIPIKPSQRGFFCDDNNLKKPFQEETVSTWATIAVGFSVSIPSVIICEVMKSRSLRRKAGGGFGKTNIKCGVLSCNLLPWHRRTLFIIFMFCFGALITNLLTDIGKVTVGGLRPYFLTVCKPNTTLPHCSQGFVTDNICTGDPKDILEARESFPSGHSSFSAYTMVFLALYLEASMPTKRTNLVKPFAQVSFIVLGLLCALSRIFDYWHHWGDVLVGLFLGTIVAFFITFRSLRLFSFAHCPKCHPGYPVDELDTGGHAQAAKNTEASNDDSTSPL